MSTWNYRVVETRSKKHGSEFILAEVFYLGKTPDKMGFCKVSPIAESLSELKKDYKMMKEAFEQPVMIWDDDREKWLS